MCPTCAFSWLDRYAKNECPKCLNPLIPAFRSLKAQKDYEDAIATADRLSPRSVRIPCRHREGKAAGYAVPVVSGVDNTECVEGTNEDDATAALLDFSRAPSSVAHQALKGQKKIGDKIDVSPEVVAVKVQFSESIDNKPVVSRHVHFAPEVTCDAGDGRAQKPQHQSKHTPLKSAIKKASHALEDFEMFKELLKQAPPGSSRVEHQPSAAEVKYPEIRMSCPTCDYGWLDTTRKNECPKCWHALFRLPTDAKKCRAFI